MDDMSLSLAFIDSVLSSVLEMPANIQTKKHELYIYTFRLHN